MTISKLNIHYLATLLWNSYYLWITKDGDMIVKLVKWGSFDYYYILAIKLRLFLNNKTKVYLIITSYNYEKKRLKMS
ncbi:hypothetical protein RIR_jg29628.t1 [Rhizophagus irregularis DAOM 181602=DAOM 197198]|nr:hypothetical protein RIR_jg29628.t1 [Rhizophagus irregularis DAOM 181602=DAOM 197198]